MDASITSLRRPDGRTPPTDRLVDAPRAGRRQGVRNARERLVQVLAFEIIGLAAVAPLCSLLCRSALDESLRLLIALSSVVMVWAALFNALFDVLEVRWARRVASDRPHRWRLVHALALEASAVVVSCPVIQVMTELGWRQALSVDLALTAVYAAYGYVYWLAFDRLRPVAPRESGRSSPHSPTTAGPQLPSSVVH